MSFTDEQIRAAVGEGMYSNPDAAAYLVKVLNERRDKTGRYWFGKVNPLDDFRVTRGEVGEYQLCFTDLAVAYGLEPASASRYRYDLRIDGKTVREAVDTAGETSIRLELTEAERSTFGPARAGQWEIELRTYRGSTGKWSRWTRVYVNSNDKNGEPVLAGVKRQD
jgi:hypothetical protein